MTWEIALVFGLIVGALVLFAWEPVSYDVTAMLVCGTLMASGILSPTEGLAGFSNPATVAIGCMFVLSEGLRRSGALDVVSELFRRLGRRSTWLALGTMMLVVGVVSGFINNTAAIAIFIPVVLAVSSDLGESPSKLLMPISFASMFGGVCTLIGTSTNILVSSIAEDHGQPAFGMFELAPMGLLFFAAGFAYLALVGVRLVPPRRPLEELTAGYGVHAYLAEVCVPEGSELIGRTLEDDATLDDLDLELVEVFDDEGASVGDARARLEAGSVLRLRGEPADIQRLARRGDLELRPARTWADAELGEGRRTLVEAVVAPDSSLPGKSLAEVDFAQRFGAAVLGLRHRGEARVDRLADVTLRGGDSLLLTTRSGDERELERDGAFVIVSPIEAEAKRRAHMPVALAILAAVVGLAAFDVLPIVVTALCGSILLVLTRTLTSGEALEAIRWRVLFLLAGVIPLGAAMDRTGAADLLSRFLTDGLGELGPRVLLAGFFGLSMMLTNVVSNQATAALLAPVAIESGHALGLDPRPLLMAVTFAASLSFMTPIGYQTNTLVYGPGHYRFTDYTKVGTPLNLLFWALATLAIPWFWPF